MKVLVTGGCGFIGSHTVVELLEAGHEVVIVDNLVNSSKETLKSIEQITGKVPTFYEVDVANKKEMLEIFKTENIDSVIHFAGLKAVGESVNKPLLYYRNNLDSTLTLLEVMQEVGCKNLVFSSSATVYGTPKSLPIREDFPLSTTNPYGTTKLIIEGILRDLYKADSSFRICILRYFNPIGAHKSGLLGENPNGIPNNLMPYIVKIATGELPYLNVFGNDYDTKDGTGVRDYIHIVDLARGHLKALEKLEKGSGIFCYNLGTGTGYSVLEIVQAFEKINHVKIPYQIAPRRPGDIAECYADPTKAKEELGFICEKTLEDMVKDSYHYVITKNKNS